MEELSLLLYYSECNGTFVHRRGHYSQQDHFSSKYFHKKLPYKAFSFGGRRMVTSC